MKAEERHQLKTNELAEWLGDLPELWRKHGSKITTWGGVALIIIAAGLWLLNTRSKAAMLRGEELQNLASRVELARMTATQQVQAREQGQEDQPLVTEGYEIGSVAKSLGEIARESAGSATGMLALIQQAEALRSELLLSDAVTTMEERETVCGEAEALYKQALADYPQSGFAVGTARVGLALIAEERSQWDVAEQRYQEIVSLADGVLAGTVYPQLAAARLKALPDIREPIEFPQGVTFAGSPPAGYQEPAPMVAPSVPSEEGSSAEATAKPAPPVAESPVPQ